MTTGPPPCAYTGRCYWDDDTDTCPCLDPEPEPPDRPVVDVPVGHYL
ncbi:hypothetical protein AB0M10_32945 [Streptomyces sp. NPDC051840]